VRLDHITLKHFLLLITEALRTLPCVFDYNPIRSGDRKIGIPASLPGGHSELDPPVPIPNTEVKQLSADGSVTMIM
jgi:hypothetical protein